VPNYQQIVVLIVRIAGVIWSGVLAIMWVLYFVEMAAGMNVQRYPTHTIIGNIAYIFLGFLIALVAKPLVHVLGHDLNR
jgi:hypothetical protein